MTVRLCETMSCISRATRLRSAAVAISACWSRSRASWRARSIRAWRYRRRLPTFVPTSTATVQKESAANPEGTASVASGAKSCTETTISVIPSTPIVAIAVTP